MHRERVWTSVTDRAVRLDHGAHRTSPRRTTFNDGVVVVCFLALVGLVVLGGLLMLLSWITTTLPVNARIACPDLPACVAPAPDGTQSIPGDDARAHEPKLTP
jgi:hypothetical protein